MTPTNPPSPKELRVLLAHPGTQHSPPLAAELLRHGLLLRYWTGFAVAGSGWGGRLLRLCPARFREKLGSRLAVGLSHQHLRTLPFLEISARRALRKLDAETVYYRRNLRFQEAIPDEELRQADVIVGYDTASWALARRAKELGKRFILDQSIGHPAEKERTFERLRRDFSEWLTSLPRKEDAIIAAEREEHALADVIIVPSEFVKRTLVVEGVDERKIRTIPYGANLSVFTPRDRSSHNTGTVTFLFVGSISARKGVPVLLEAWRKLQPKNARLWLAGSGTVPEREMQSLPESVQFLGQQGRSEVAALMQRADVFVFPSFFEGLAIAQLEALASGLPVISTPEAGASGIVTEGENGFIVDAGDAAALGAKIRMLAEDPALRHRMQDGARACREKLDWHVYGARWADMLRELKAC